MTIVVNARNGTREFECHPGEKILHAGLRSGLELPYECATGTCGSCKARLVSGRPVSEWPDAPGGRYLKARPSPSCASAWSMEIARSRSRCR
jgi:toluene monooxygenase electron transfer component